MLTKRDLLGAIVLGLIVLGVALGEVVLLWLGVVVLVLWVGAAPPRG
jgi:hypothetical protein